MVALPPGGQEMKFYTRSRLLSSGNLLITGRKEKSFRVSRHTVDLFSLTDPKYPMQFAKVQIDLLITESVVTSCFHYDVQYGKV